MTTPGCEWTPGTRTAIAKMIDHKPIDDSSRQLSALHDTIKNSMSTLKNLYVSTKSWDPILCFLIRKTVSSCTEKFSACTNGDSNVKGCTDAYWAARLHAGDDKRSTYCNTPPSVSSVLRACSRVQEMDPKTRRQAIIQIGAQIVCLQLIRLKTVDERHHSCYTKDRLAIQWSAQQPLQATTTLEDIICSRPPRYYYKGQPVNHKHVAL